MKNLKTFEGVFEDVPDLIVSNVETFEEIRDKCVNVYELEAGVTSNNQYVIKETGFVSHGELNELLLILVIKEAGLCHLQYYRGNVLVGEIYYTDVVGVDDLFAQMDEHLKKYIKAFKRIDDLSFEVIGLENQISSKEAAIITLVDVDLYDI